MSKKLFACAIGSLAIAALSACSRVNENNVVESYEWFKATNSAITAKVAMIQMQAPMINSASGVEREKIILETNGMKQSCMELVGQYNGRASMITRGGLALPNSLPNQIDLSICQ